jgi:intracellular multiplication protein IcmT
MWRNTGQPVRVLMLDARACFPVLAVMVYWSWTTLYIAAAGVVFFSLISILGLTLPSMLRMLRRMLVGPVRTAVPAWRRRRLA